MANTRQKLAGGAVIGVAALAFYLGTQWKGLGPGGTGTGFGTTSADSGATEEDREPDLVGDEAVSIDTSRSSGGAGPPIVSIIMSDEDYLVSTTGDLTQTKAANLSEVAHAALTATGDSQGIRVRVYHKKDATVGVMDDLKRKLDQVGIPAQAIQYMDTPLE